MAERIKKVRPVLYRPTENTQHNIAEKVSVRILPARVLATKARVLRQQVSCGL